jgi:hypothetical protein
LATHFGRLASTIFNRAQFTHRQQRSGESVTQYIAALREMASQCEFAAVQLDERVYDQFVARASCDGIRERLLQEPVNRTLEELVSLEVTIERAWRRRQRYRQQISRRHLSFTCSAVATVRRHRRRRRVVGIVAATVILLAALTARQVGSYATIVESRDTFLANAVVARSQIVALPVALPLVITDQLKVAIAANSAIAVEIVVLLQRTKSMTI